MAQNGVRTHEIKRGPIQPARHTAQDTPRRAAAPMFIFARRDTGSAAPQRLHGFHEPYRISVGYSLDS